MGFDDIFDRADAAVDGAQGFVAGLQTLKTFKRRVDALLVDLQDSAAGPDSMIDRTLAVSHLGTGFSEASGLYSAYQAVHDQLELLSQTFADQIEAMGMLVQMADNDYQNIDAEQRDRLWEIRRSTQDYYETATRNQPVGPPADAGQPAPQEGTMGGSM